MFPVRVLIYDTLVSWKNNQIALKKFTLIVYTAPRYTLLCFEESEKLSKSLYYKSFRNFGKYNKYNSWKRIKGFDEV